MNRHMLFTQPRQFGGTVARIARSFGLLLAVLLVGGSGSIAADSDADRIFFNARAYTLDATAPWAEAVAVRGDTIVYVGDNAGALALAGEETVRHNLRGEMLLPGFIDAHMHPLSGGGYARALSLGTSGTVDGWLTAIPSVISR
jgi:predicted amidohydrolase YtcJ